MDFYDYQRLVGKIEDIPELRNEFIAVFDTKTKTEAARFGLAYGEHILNLTKITPCAEILQAFCSVQKWIDGKTSYHEARNIDIYGLVRNETNPLIKRFYKTMAQIACIPHVKFHALWASDMAITLINQMHPNTIDEVRKERERQISILKGV